MTESLSRRWKMPSKALKVGGSSAILLGILAAGTSGGSSSAASSTAGVSSKSVTIGVVADLTGNAAQQDVDSNKAFDAVVSSINASGGINGRKINLVTEDDQSTQAGNISATESLIEAHHAFMVVEVSTQDDGEAEPYLSKNGIPVIGMGLDAQGSTWNNNFTPIGDLDNNPNHDSTALGEAFKYLGATKVGGVTFNVPAAQRGLQLGIDSATAVGLKAGYVNNTASIPLTDPTPYVSQMQSSGTNGDFTIELDASALTYYAALDQAGVKMVKISVNLFANNLLTGANLSPMQGVYVEGYYQPAQISTAATRAEIKVLHKYGLSGYPDWNTTNGYATAELLKTALQVAGPSLSRSGLISKLRKVTDFTAGGLAAKPVNFTTTATQPNEPGYGPGNCMFLLKVENTKFVPVRKAPFCGSTITVKS
jgi:branched-chain amino acid transport system substrate-binding protein